MNSVWTESISHPSFPPLQGDAKTDVLIIGGGMAGLLCTHMLKRAGVDCLLVEAENICHGITGNTTAKITLQHGLIYDKLICRFGFEKAQMYLEAQKKALREYERLCGTFPCDYEKKDSYVYSLLSREKIEKELSALSRLGGRGEFCSSLSLPFPVAGAVKVKNQAQFHPLKFAFTLAGDLPVYENTKVLEMGKNEVITNRGRIRYQKIIVATHFPFLNKHGFYFLKLYQSRSYVLCLQGAGRVNGMYVDEGEGGFSFREYGDLLLLGGGAHRTGKKSSGWRSLEDFARRHYPAAKPVYRWATQDCMTLDGVPYIGRYSRSTPNLFVATGFQKWGMTSSMVSALVLCDLVQEKKSPYEALFSPSRSILHPQLFCNVMESTLGLVTPTTPRCPHLGCALKYNKAEHSWDCSCHGSRFTPEGKLIDNPATGDKRMKKAKTTL